MNARLRLPTRQAIHDSTRLPETQCIPPLLQAAEMPPSVQQKVQQQALRLARGLREHRAGLGKAGLVQSLLQEFALSSQEGVALMCLAEALLRIPDQATRDALIRDKIGRGHWQRHLGQSESIFVNAASWGLMLTGKLMATHSGAGLEAALMRALGRGGEPVIRKGLDMAMRLMGEQFVTGQTIAQALDHARAQEDRGFRYSYDMLGEAAMTMADARRYAQAYEQAIESIGASAKGRGVIHGPGISIKLSALHPRYTRWQAQRVHDELYPALLHLAQRARAHDIGLNIDAEESERLELSLDLLERLCLEPSLAGWQGLGFVIQAYQKRCPAVVAHLVSLARTSGRRLMVRLVKGAYWDSEIKRAQVEGLSGFPVYTRKAHTDVSYLACAKALLAAPDAVFPQFATHNAHTVASVIEMARAALGPWREGQYEFQCLHGMGEPLYEQLVGPGSEDEDPNGEEPRRPCRIYAPVGPHETLLAYLVRRLLENGANTSFVNRVANADVPLEHLVEDPVQVVRAGAGGGEAVPVVGLPHPAIALPQEVLGPRRRNSRGLDLVDEAVIAQWDARVRQGRPGDAAFGPGEDKLLGRLVVANGDEAAEGRDESAAAAVAPAIEAAEAAFAPWSDRPAEDRAQMLERAADALEGQMLEWMSLLADEAGKTAPNAMTEMREAVDFLRYYAQQARACAQIGGRDSVRGLGPVACISPWNFPLAIFIGQVATALAAGNSVVAKPAEQTPRIAQAAVRVLWDAGVPRGALELVCGTGEAVGAPLVADARIKGVLFTGSTEVAQLIQAQLAGRLLANGQPLPLVAETGGQNAMIVDSSALLEQVTVDVIQSAFDSAGQRCSALRVLCVQAEAAAPLLEMIKGAMRELRVGRATELATDVGPVIDEPARQAIEAHVERMQSLGHRVFRVPIPADLHGTFVAPTLIEIESLDALEREVFGPVLHVMRFERSDLSEVLHQVRRSGYGLTMGVHSRIDETIAEVQARSAAGNLYVNRNMVGAVVGVQPFGGQGLSGTGPKAGGPLTLLRWMDEVPLLLPRALVQGSGVEFSGGRPTHAHLGDDKAAPVLVAWLHAQGPRHAAAAHSAQAMLDATFTHDWRVLAGPTGERNAYAVEPRESVLCVAEEEAALLNQTAAALAVGAGVVWQAHWAALHDRLPPEVAAKVALAADWQHPAVVFDAVLIQGTDDAVRTLLRQLAQRPGPIISVTRCTELPEPIGLHRLVTERSISVNTAAAGGNASLMTIG